MLLRRSPGGRLIDQEGELRCWDKAFEKTSLKELRFHDLCRIAGTRLRYRTAGAGDRHDHQTLDDNRIMISPAIAASKAWCLRLVANRVRRQTELSSSRKGGARPARR
jgi:hypothetical protein